MSFHVSMAQTIFGQLVVGPPGSGKSTYCKFICENLKQVGRNVKIINLDPANDCLQYKPAINIMDLINVETVMTKGKCGPNGAMVYCIETMNENFGWLYDKIVDLIENEEKQFKEIEEKEKSLGVSEAKPNQPNHRPYLLIDCPGQAEIYTHHVAMRELIKKLTLHKKHFDLRLTCVNLCEAHLSSDLGKYIGVLLNSLFTMLNLELPHVNVLSKVDLLEVYGKTRFNLDFYCEVQSLRYLLETELDSPFFDKYKKLTVAIADVIEDNGLVSFIPLDIKRPEDIYQVLLQVDRANGYFVDDLDLSILQLTPQLMEMMSGRRLANGGNQPDQ